MRVRRAVSGAALAAMLSVAGCQGTGQQQAYHERYGPVENWPSTQVRERLGRGE